MYGKIEIGLVKRTKNDMLRKVGADFLGISFFLVFAYKVCKKFSRVSYSFELSLLHKEILCQILRYGLVLYNAVDNGKNRLF